MSRKPRLVHEGSPIIDDSVNDDNNDERVFDCTSHGREWHYGNTDDGSSQYNKPEPFKLKTRLVVGDDVSTATPYSAPWNMNKPDNHDRAAIQRFNEKEIILDAMITDDHEPNDIMDTHHMYPTEPSHNYIDPSHHQQFSHPTTFSGDDRESVLNDHILHNPPPHIYQMPSPLTSPLVVIDGANIAYNYAESLNPSLTNYKRQFGRQPNPKGITLAIQYFLKHQCRVQAVVPISWYKLKPRPGDQTYSVDYHNKNPNYKEDAKMLTEEVEELRRLRNYGFLVPCPPGDNDDAYALALARREEDRLFERKQTSMQQDLHEMVLDDDNNMTSLPLGGYILSNDFFHDAVLRDQKQQMSRKDSNPGVSSLSRCNFPIHNSLQGWLKKHRISYTFSNVGVTSEEDGNIELEFFPNPTNDLIEAIVVLYRHNQGF